MRLTRRRFLGATAGALFGAACSAGREPAVPTVAGTRTVRYGDAPKQFLELSRTPSREDGPVVVVVHGGFWQAGYGLELMRPLVPSLLAEGWTAANLEYRGVGDRGGGWPGTLEDVAAAADALVSVLGVAGPVVTLGHSAGGHLAVWLAGRHRLPDGVPGSAPRLHPAGAVAQAGVLDLVAGAGARLGGDAVQALLGGQPAEVPDRYVLASPVALLPIGVPVELVNGRDDLVVPPDQSHRYRAAAEEAGDRVTLTEVPGDHFSLIDPTTPAWTACVAALARLVGTAPGPESVTRT